MLVWTKVGECLDEGFFLQGRYGTNALTILQEKAKMTPEKVQVAWANEKADKSAKTWVSRTVMRWQSVLLKKPWIHEKRVCGSQVWLHLSH